MYVLQLFLFTVHRANRFADPKYFVADVDANDSGDGQHDKFKRFVHGYHCRAAVLTNSFSPLFDITSTSFSPSPLGLSLQRSRKASMLPRNEDHGCHSTEQCCNE